MKILFSIFLLIFFSASAFAQETKKQFEGIITTGKGSGVVSLDVDRKIIESELGEGTERTRDEKFYWIDYTGQGIQILFTTKENRPYKINFYNRQRRFEQFVVSALVKTDKGISWSSTLDDVLKSYGEPKNDTKSRMEDIELGTTFEFRTLEYDGINFLFQNSKLKRITVYK
jgi:hypothetical protein